LRQRLADLDQGARCSGASRRTAPASRRLSTTRARRWPAITSTARLCRWRKSPSCSALANKQFPPRLPPVDRLHARSRAPFRRRL